VLGCVRWWRGVGLLVFWGGWVGGVVGWVGGLAGLCVVGGGLGGGGASTLPLWRSHGASHLLSKQPIFLPSTLSATSARKGEKQIVPTRERGQLAIVRSLVLKHPINAERTCNPRQTVPEEEKIPGNRQSVKEAWNLVRRITWPTINEKPRT